jgi:hypothetical protein
MSSLKEFSFHEENCCDSLQERNGFSADNQALHILQTKPALGWPRFGLMHTLLRLYLSIVYTGCFTTAQRPCKPDFNAKKFKWLKIISNLTVQIFVSIARVDSV